VLHGNAIGYFKCAFMATWFQIYTILQRISVNAHKKAKPYEKVYRLVLSARYRVRNAPQLHNSTKILNEHSQEI